MATGYSVEAVATVALVMPAVFDLSLYGSLEPHPIALDRLSFWTAFILISAYGGSLIYAFTAHRDLFRGPAERNHGESHMTTRTALGLLARPRCSSVRFSPRSRDSGSPRCSSA